MSIPNRLAALMVVLSVFTAGIVSLLVYGTIVAAAVPAELGRAKADARATALTLSEFADATRNDVLSVAGAPSVTRLVEASAANDGDPSTDLTQGAAHRYVTDLFVAFVTNKLRYHKLRIIGVSDGGREIVRVDRMGPGGGVRIVEGAELQQKGDRPFLASTLSLRPGEVYVSDLDLNREYGAVQTPYVPTLRVATPLVARNGTAFGILIANVDMRQPFEQIHSLQRDDKAVYVTNNRGDYLVHPDASREFGFDLGFRSNVGDEAPELTGMLAANDPEAAEVGSADGSLVAAAVPVRLAGGPRVVVFETMRLDALLPLRRVLATSVAAGLAAALVSAVLAWLVARSLTVPIVRVTAALDAFGRGDAPLPLSGESGSEIGLLTRAFERMRDEIQAKTDELERSNAELEQFAYVASHDLQEPLRMVASYTELLAMRYRGQLDERADTYIEHSVEGARRMQHLVADLLRFSRAGERESSLEPVDTAAVVRTVLSAMRHSVDETGARVEVGDLPVVSAVRGQLDHVFLNLLSNAIKFRSGSGPSMHVSATREPDAWRFSVRDDGIGIEKAHAGRIFEMFQRLHERGKYEGSGIGLAIARKIVERHGGRIWFESEPGLGSEFLFTVPAEPTADATHTNRDRRDTHV